ncbi:dicarboxylate/amino acid:cation symporter [Cyclobacteriaceae bacterium]|nr:dicarboxylate/amino acid:cation symporter [Cyclobacteriaceae bacterium]
MKRLPLYIQILLGLTLGLVWGIAASAFKLPVEISHYWIEPFGEIFLKLLKMIAVPLVIASLIVGISNLNDIAKLSRMGGRTVLIYLLTTLFALTVGITTVNIIDPGASVSEETRQQLLEIYQEDATQKISKGGETQGEMNEVGPLAPLVNMIPDNIVGASANNGNMLQMVTIAILLGIAAIKLPEEKKKYFIGFFDNLNEILIELIEMIMKIAPLGVFALIGAFVAQLKDFEILYSLGWYCLTVFLGLAVMALVVYPLMLSFFTKINYFHFFKAIRSAIILAFSTSSSSATLPVTLENCEKNLGISNKVASFVLPLGATINMDGTSLYQAVAAVFICQVTGYNLSLAEQLTIVFTALLASIGTAGVPGVGIIMLTIVLGSIGVEEAYIALILGPDRILDMCRTVINVIGDATTATIIASTENQITPPVVQTDD